MGVYQGDTLLGTSDADGRVAYAAQVGQGPVTVTAKDSEGNLSAPYIAVVYTPQGNTDGTPTHVWRNAADTTDSLNVSWLANPLYAANTAKLRLADSEAGLESAEAQNADCDLVAFTDGSAAYVCGAEVTGLTPGTTYYYQVGDGTHWSAVKSFTTGYANTGINALVLGDLQERENTNITGILNSLDLDKYDLAIQTGDLVDNGSTVPPMHTGTALLP